MAINIIIAVGYLNAVFFGFAIGFTGLWLGIRWSKANCVTSRRLFVAAATIYAIHLLIVAACGQIAIAAPNSALAARVSGFLAEAVASCVTIATCFHLPMWRTIQTYLGIVAMIPARVLLLGFVFNACFAEVYTTPTTSMAPTILPKHWTAPCPVCARPATCAVQERPSRKGELMICDRFHQTTIREFVLEPHSGDRFVAAKFLKPRRWDIALFVSPADSERLYIYRIVGMPGEEIVIRNGSVHANGEKLIVPDFLRGITYSEPPPHFRDRWGTPERPARLASDEYFVLGDFTERSLDSRTYWQGAPGHSVFAVPQSHIRGVITHICWPPSRWRTFR